MCELNVNVVSRPAVRTAGLKIRTTMARASQDCPLLWSRDFAPRMESFPIHPDYANQSFGVSVMLDEDSFDYWATMALADGAPLPEGMDILTLPGGPYAECLLPSLEKLGEAYMHVYRDWSARQDRYTMDMRGCSIEVYTAKYLETGELTIYCPLLEK